MQIDTANPWPPLSTPENQAEHDARDAFEAVRDQIWELTEKLDRLRWVCTEARREALKNADE